jgi:hypothetical protein
MNAVIHQDNHDVAIKDIDGPTIKQPTSVVNVITTWVAIRLHKTRCRPVWRTLNV